MSTRYIGTYICPWPSCGHHFTHEFGVIDTIKGSPTVQGRKGICSAVKCPRCGAGLRPRDDAKKIEEKKEKVMPRVR